MTVLIAQDTPPAIRGMFKRWFVEPRPNVFVGTLNRRTRDKVLEYLKRNAEGLSLLMLTSEPNCQGFRIERWGQPDRSDVFLSGLWLVAERESSGSSQDSPSESVPN
ncbi:MAG: type I-E CRISPR-associated endoribonuclease Cas2e [Limisphaerales bacterium]